MKLENSHSLHSKGVVDVCTVCMSLHYWFIVIKSLGLVCGGESAQGVARKTVQSGSWTFKVMEQMSQYLALCCEQCKEIEDKSYNIHKTMDY